MSRSDQKADSFLSDLLHPRPTSLSNRAVFASASILFALIELLPALFGVRGSDDPSVIPWTLVMCTAVALAGFFPAGGGLVFMVIAILASVSTTSVAAPMIGQYLILAYWISRRWYWPSALGFVVVAGTETWFSTMPIPTLSGILSGGAFAVFGGILLQFYRKKLSAEQARSLKLELAARQASERAREELGAMLHDSVVRDLSRIALMSRAGIKDSTDVERWELVEQLSLEAMETLRELPTSTNENQVGGGQSTAEALNECRAILSQADITLDVEDTYICRLKLDSDIQRIVNMALLEGSTNALKYAPARSVVELQASENDGELSVVLINEMAAGAGPEPLSGHFGLRNLTAEIERKGGSLHSWDAGHKWFMALTLPLSHDDHQNEEME
ncbi:MAG: hypothetical protein WAS54_09505 [Scrofimicrobium sp.]